MTSVRRMRYKKEEDFSQAHHLTNLVLGRSILKARKNKDTMEICKDKVPHLLLVLLAILLIPGQTSSKAVHYKSYDNEAEGEENSVNCTVEGQFFPNPFDCSEFFRCVHGEVVRFSCPGDLEFNAELDVCDWPQSANCHEVARPTTMPSPATTTNPEGTSTSSSTLGPTSDLGTSEGQPNTHRPSTVDPASTEEEQSTDRPTSADPVSTEDPPASTEDF